MLLFKIMSNNLPPTSYNPYASDPFLFLMYLERKTIDGVFKDDEMNGDKL